MIIKSISKKSEPMPCYLCKENEAAYHTTIEINSAATITLSLCEECAYIPASKILEKLRLKND